MIALYPKIILFFRVVFGAAVLCVLLLFTVGSSHISIDTNLKDLDPSVTLEQGQENASERLMRDINRRLIIVVQGYDPKIVDLAVTKLQLQIDSVQQLQVLSSHSIIENYVSVLSPYQFNLLSNSQRETLIGADISDLAAQAQHKLYQLSDSARLTSFDKDPLGWFSEYLLSRVDSIDLGGRTLENNYRVEDVRSGAVKYSKSFTVLIDSYPESMREQESLYHIITGIAASIDDEYQVTTLNSGMFFFTVDSAQSAKNDIQLIAIGSTIGVIILILLVFRSLLPLSLSLISIVIGVGFGIFVSVLVHGSIHVLTIVFGASLIGIVVDYSLHYFYHFLSDNNDRKIASSKNKKSTLYRAMTLSVITSIIGYSSLALSELILLKKVALFSCSGLFVAWLSVIVLGPLVVKRPIVIRQALLTSIIDFIHRLFFRRPIIMASFGLFIAVLSSLYLAVSDVRVNDDPRLFFHVSSHLINQEQEVAKLTHSYEPARYLIVEGESEQKIYEILALFYRNLGDGSQYVTSVLDWLQSPDMQKENHLLQDSLYMDGGVLDVFYKNLGLPEEQGSVIKTAYNDARGQYLSFSHLVERLPSVPPLWIEHEGIIYSFVLIRKDSPLENLLKISQNISGIQYVSTVEDAMNAIRDQRVTGATFLLVAYSLIALMLIFYYRRISAVFLLLIPMSSSLISIAALSIIGQQITLFHVMALFLVLGLGMDYIIFANEMKEKQAITQQAILLSAMTSLLSLGLLAFSSMPIVQAFGSTILIGNAINFIAAIGLFNTPQSRENV